MNDLKATDNPREEAPQAAAPSPAPEAKPAAERSGKRPPARKTARTKEPGAAAQAPPAPSREESGVMAPPPAEAGAMSPPKASPAVAILIILALMEAAGMGYLYMRYYSRNLMAMTLQAKLEQTVGVAKEQSTELARKAETLEAIKKEFMRVEGEKRALARSVEEKTQRASDLEQRLKASEESGKAAKDNLERQQQVMAYLRRRFTESKDIERRMRERLEDLTRTQADLEARIARLREGATAAPTPEEGIPLKETVVSEKAAAANEITGQVLVSNDKWNFVIANLGSEDGIAVGDEGVVEKDGAPIGKIRVKKLYDKMCLADIADISPNQKIEKNYPVKFIRSPAPVKE